MADTLSISLVQTDLLWHQPQQNRELLGDKMAPLAGHTDLIVLPEMFTSGFTNEPDSVDGDNTPTLNWLREQAKSLNAAITGSVVFKTGVGNTNRQWFVTPAGDVHHYDKVHLFRMADEHKRYQPGKERVVVEYRGWRILLSVCYDLRFPVFCRNRNDYDLMLCVANWPSSRRLPWRALLQARAIENLAYVAGVNRVGVDGRGWHYSGDSLLADYQGELLIDQPMDTEFVQTITLNKHNLEAFRRDFPAWMDADSFELTLKQ